MDLTPHPKEAARLLKSTVEAIQADRIAAIQALSAQYGGVVILKGAGTLVMAHGQKAPCIYIEQEGLPILGTAGTGDVLSGLIGGLLAQGKSIFELDLASVCIAMQLKSMSSGSGVCWPVISFCISVGYSPRKSYDHR